MIITGITKNRVRRKKKAPSFEVVIFCFMSYKTIDWSLNGTLSMLADIKETDFCISLYRARNPEMNDHSVLDLVLLISL